jgi:hypothetical protein
MIELGHSERVDELAPFARVTEAIAELEPGGLTVSAQEVEFVWVAAGLKRRWRVVSELRTYGEWDRVADAYAFLGLLLEGNPNLTRLA